MSEPAAPVRTDDSQAPAPKEVSTTPTITVTRDRDRVVAIQIRCRCGEVLNLVCDYNDAGPAPSQPPQVTPAPQPETAGPA